MYATRGNETPEVVGYLERLATYTQNVAWKRHKEASNKVLERAKSLTKEQLKKLRPLEVMPKQASRLRGSEDAKEFEGLLSLHQPRQHIAPQVDKSLWSDGMPG